MNDFPIFDVIRFNHPFSYIRVCATVKIKCVCVWCENLFNGKRIIIIIIVICDSLSVFYSQTPGMREQKFRMPKLLAIMKFFASNAIQYYIRYHDKSR